MPSNENLLLVDATKDAGPWGESFSSVKVVLLLKEARLALLEAEYSTLMINFMNPQELEQIESFVSGLKAHPRFSTLRVVINPELLERDKELIKKLHSAGVNFAKNPEELIGTSEVSDYHGDSTGSATNDVEKHNQIVLDPEFAEVFNYLKNYTAKVLAQIKIEESARTPILPRQQLVMRYLMLLQDELLKDDPVE